MRGLSFPTLTRLFVRRLRQIKTLNALRDAPVAVVGDNVPMLGTRYFFHVTDGSLYYSDRHGTCFLTPADAIAHAHEIASELADDSASIAFTVAVRDVADKEIARVSFKVEDHQ